jgi:FSR family fosmidomycin resistance protein-like MFS transporter
MSTIAIPAAGPVVPARRILATTCGAHAVHDGFVDVLYVLFPLWQAQFGLSFGEIGLLKTVYSGTMAGFQIPAGRLAERIGERGLLAVGTLVSAAGFLLASGSTGFLVLGACLALVGLGASVQHPLGSALTAGAFGGARLRTALSTYNFSGDVGKVAVPALAALLLSFATWPLVTLVLGAIGVVAALVIWAALAGAHGGAEEKIRRSTSIAIPESEARIGFAALSTLGVIDSATRMGFLTLLPFLLTGKGASVTTVGLALSLTFAGGAAGKFICGVIAERVGILRSVIITETATALGIVLILGLDLGATMIVLPVVGIALNGTSSVLYGTVSELVPEARRARAFGVFYTVTIGASAISPFLYGGIADWLGLNATAVLVAAIVLLTVPLTLPLRPAMRRLAEAEHRS